MTQTEFNRRIVELLITMAPDHTLTPANSRERELWSELQTLQQALPVGQSADDD